MNKTSANKGYIKTHSLKMKKEYRKLYENTSVINSFFISSSRPTQRAKRGPLSLIRFERISSNRERTYKNDERIE